MEIIRAKHMGFCFGVMEAVNVCNELKTIDRKKYILGMLVHNTFVVNQMKKNGFEIIEEQDLLDDKDNLSEGDIVIIRAHGTSKNIMQKLKDRKVEVHDVTCVFVSKIRDQIIEAQKNGYEILFVGDKNHPEVRGIISYADSIIIFKNLEEAQKIKIVADKKYFLSTQTTLNKKKFEEIKQYFSRYKNVLIFDKICGATSVRQQSVEDLAPNVDVMLIVGDKKSSNTNKLFEISKKLNENSYHIEDEKDLDISIIKGKQKIGITAGASTPELIINNIESKIRGI